MHRCSGNFASPQALTNCRTQTTEFTGPLALRSVPCFLHLPVQLNRRSRFTRRCTTSNQQLIYKQLVRRSTCAEPTFGSVHLVATLAAKRIHGFRPCSAASAAGFGPFTKIRSQHLCRCCTSATPCIRREQPGTRTRYACTVFTGVSSRKRRGFLLPFQVRSTSSTSRATNIVTQQQDPLKHRGSNPLTCGSLTCDPNHARDIPIRGANPLNDVQYISSVDALVRLLGNRSPMQCSAILTPRQRSQDDS